MNIYSISQDSIALNEIGHTLDTAEKIKLEMGLLRLIQLANADQLLFWGKIFTTSTPYYIAVGVDFKGHYAFPHKTFYYATDKFNFKALPQLDKFNQSFADQFNTLPFTGLPQTILRKIESDGEQKKQQAPKAEGNENVDSQDQDAQKKIAPKNYTEEDRISYTVRSIQTECQIVPKKAFKMCTEHEIRYNEKFTASKQVDLSKFVHFRYPQTELALSTLESTQSIFRDDIFDQIQNATFWSIQPNTENNLITVRSFLWPGYLAYSFNNRNVFGGIYFGNGIKNVDLPFYI